MNHLKHLWLVLFILASFTTQGQTLLTGNVANEYREPLPFVTVTLYTYKESLFVTGTVTDSLGNYKLIAKGGNYQIKYSLIGFEAQSQNIEIDTVPFIRNTVLKESDNQLDEIIVTASRTPFSLSKDGLNVNVEHSILKNEVQTVELLKKIPGIIKQGDGIEVAGRGAPAYYINGKEVLDFTDIQNLSVDDIQTVKLITSPDSRYASDKQAVILIKTKQKADGLTFTARGSAVQGNRFSHNEALNLSYVKEKWQFSGAYTYEDSKISETGLSHQIIETETHWDTYGSSRKREHSKEHYFQTGLTYTIDEKSEFGAQYTGKVTHHKNFQSTSIQVEADKTPFAEIASINQIKPEQDNHHINLFYRTQLNKKWDLNIYSDYVKKKTSQLGFISEDDSEWGMEDITYHSRSSWDVFALNARLSYDAGAAGTFAAGYNTSWVNGYSLIDNVRVLNNGKSKDQEEKHSIYLSHSIDKGDFSFNTGLRYEYLQSKLTDSYLDVSDKKKTYHHIFPNISFSHSNEEVQQSLSYSLFINRPEFSSLNNNVTYVNRFSYEKGNINLKPALMHHVSYSIFYKFLYLNLMYDHTKNLISTGFHADPQNSSVLISYPENFRSVNNLVGVLNLQHTIKWWKPSLTVTCMKSFFTHRGINGKVVKAKDPIIFLGWNNGLTLPKDFYISADYTHGFGGDLQMINMHHYSSLDIRLQKKLLKGKLQLSLDAYDVFNQDNTQWTTRLNNASLHYSESKNRRIGVTAIYRFKSQPKNYNGSTAAQKELERLNIDY